MASKDWALALWDRGYQVVLVPLKQKSPAFAWKRFQTERVPRELVETWFSQGEHNIALISGTISGTVVVDGDSADACGYIESITPPTMKVLTSKGAHYYFRHPGGGRVPNSVRVLDKPPIDLRGDGGLTIGPGSLHASGFYYRLPEDVELLSVHDLPAFRREWFPLPEKIQETSFLRPVLRFPGPDQQEAYEAAKRYMANVPGAIQGAGGDHHTYTQACRLVRGFNLTDDEALSLLQDWNATCSPAWAEAELAAKVVHARNYGTGQFGSMLPRAQAADGLLCYGWPN